MSTSCQTCGTQIEQHSGRGRPRKFCPVCVKLSAASSKRAHKRHVRAKLVSDLPQCCRDARKARATAHGTQQIEYVMWGGPDLAARVAYSAICPIEIAKQNWPIEVRSIVGGAHVKSSKVRTCDQHKQHAAYWRVHAHYKPHKNGDAMDMADAMDDMDSAFDVAMKALEAKRSEGFRICRRSSIGFLPREVRQQITPSGTKYGYDSDAERLARDYMKRYSWQRDGWGRELVTQASALNMSAEVLYDDERFCAKKPVDAAWWLKTADLQLPDDLDAVAVSVN